MTLKILSYNIRFGGGGREDQIAAVIRMSEPDLVILQEATDARVVERLAQATGMTLWASRSGYSVGFMSRKRFDRMHYLGHHRTIDRSKQNVGMIGHDYPSY